MIRVMSGSLLAITLLGPQARLLTAAPRTAEGRQVSAAMQAARRDTARLAPGTYTYGISFNGNVVGTTTSTIARDGRGWVVTQSMPGVSAEWRFADDFAPVLATQAAAAAGLDVRVAFTPGHATGTAKLPAQMGGDKAIDTPLPAGTVAAGMETLVAMTADLSDDRTLTILAFNATANRVETVTARVVGSETVTVPAGTFDTWKVEFTGSERASTAWMRKAGPHVVVKQALAAQPIVLELQSAP